MQLFRIMELAGIRRSYLLLPLVLAGIAALLDGFAMGALLPIFKGVIEGNFAFLGEWPAVRRLHSLLSPGPEGGITLPFLALCSIAGGAMVLKAWFVYFARTTLFRRSSFIAHKVRTAIFSKCLRYGKRYFDSEETGQLHTGVAQFPLQLGDDLFRFSSTASALLPLFVYAALLLMLSWKLTLVCLVLGLLFLLTLKPMRQKLRNRAQVNAEHVKQVDNYVHRVFSSITVVKVNAAQKEEENRFFEVSRRSADSRADAWDKTFFADLLLQLMIWAAVGLVGLVAAYFIGDMLSNKLPHFAVYSIILKRSIDVLRMANGVQMYYVGLSGVMNDIVQRLESDPLHSIVPSGSLEFSGLKQRIEICNLTFSYDRDTTALRDVNLTIERGETVALVGPSGAGKSTIVQLLLRLYDCPPATVFIDGVDIRDFEINSLCRRIAYVDQRHNLFHDTLRNNLLYGVHRAVSDDEIAGALQSVRLHHLVDTLPRGVETLIGDAGIMLSGGEAQRLALARAMLKDVELLILDEATSALDSETEEEVQAAFDRVSEGKTVIVIAHRFSTLKNADKIVAIQSGRVIEQGALGELLERDGLFAKLYRAQQQFH